MQQISPKNTSIKRRKMDFYGLKIEILWPQHIEITAFEKEFQFFDEKNPESEEFVPQLRISLNLGRPRVEDYSFLSPRFSTPRNVCYQQNDLRIVNYHNDALLLEQLSDSSIEIISEDPQLLESILYTVIIAKTGAHFDKLGRFRVHSLSFLFDGRGYMVLLPMGGGKSTLLLNILSDERFSLISEDTPLLDRHGKLWPFPVKIGVLPGKVPDDIPKSMISTIRHLEGVQKQVIDMAYLEDRIAEESHELAGIFVGVRYLGKGTEIVKMGYFQALRTLVRDCVVGVGVYQGLEFILSRSNWELLKKVGLGCRRLAVCMRAILKVPVYEFRMGTTAEDNAAELLSFIEKTSNHH